MKEKKMLKLKSRQNVPGLEHSVQLMPEASQCGEGGDDMELALISDVVQSTPNTDLGIIFILTTLFPERGLGKFP